MNQQQEQHKMIVVKEYDTGIIEFYCPDCGRRILMSFPPHYHREVLYEGNSDAIHYSGTGEANIEIMMDAEKNDDDTLPKNIIDSIKNIFANLNF